MWVGVLAVNPAFTVKRDGDVVIHENSDAPIVAFCRIQQSRSTARRRAHRNHISRNAHHRRNRQPSIAVALVVNAVLVASVTAIVSHCPLPPHIHKDEYWLSIDVVNMVGLPGKFPSLDIFILFARDPITQRFVDFSDFKKARIRVLKAIHPDHNGGRAGPDDVKNLNNLWDHLMEIHRSGDSERMDETIRAINENGAKGWQSTWTPLGGNRFANVPLATAPAPQPAAAPQSAPQPPPAAAQQPASAVPPAPTPQQTGGAPATPSGSGRYAFVGGCQQSRLGQRLVTFGGVVLTTAKSARLRVRRQQQRVVRPVGSQASTYRSAPVAEDGSASAPYDLGSGSDGEQFKGRGKEYLGRRKRQRTHEDDDSDDSVEFVSEKRSRNQRNADAAKEAERERRRKTLTELINESKSSNKSSMVLVGVVGVAGDSSGAEYVVTAIKGQPNMHLRVWNTSEEGRRLKPRLGNSRQTVKNSGKSFPPYV
ncbi:hypothetical protein NX059_004052 [Plenodomus lindquistii]|nr:hypothetical protein NX059_004052 [Plenodomus lindquistii]